MLAVFAIQGCDDFSKNSETKEIKKLNADLERFISEADSIKNLRPITVTANHSDRSTGGIHDFYSEGDYWWPDPDNPEGPYIRRDGMSNPDNFIAHRRSMIRLSQVAGSLSTAFQITDQKDYLEKLKPHLIAWFVDSDTKMNPNLLYAQAIKGRSTGRGIGIIDTVHLIDVVKAIEFLNQEKIFSENEYAQIKAWFADYLTWITTHPFGIEEKNNGNNHSVTWALQVAAFSSLVDNQDQLKWCRDFFKKSLLPNQMAKDGSFPKELVRTKPYGYSIFVLDAMMSICHIASTDNDNLFLYTTHDGKNIKKGMEFLYPFLLDKAIWPYEKDVMYWDDWPVNQPSLLFSGLEYEEQKYLNLWKSLPSEYDNPEVIRNLPIKYPLIWLNKNQLEKVLEILNQ